MFYSGDKIVCNLPDNKYKFDNNCYRSYRNLTSGKEYTIVTIKISGYISVIDDNDEQNTFNPNVFLSLKEYRDQKIEKILKKV